LSPNDEFADYETWDRSNLNDTEAKKPEMLKYEYAREALKTGLVLASTLGVNPYKFGVVNALSDGARKRRVERRSSFPRCAPSRTS